MTAKFKHLLARKKLVVVGLNSGTSIDSLDMSVVRIERNGRRCRIEFIDGTTRSFPKELRDNLLSLVDSISPSLDDMLILDQHFGQFCGKAASAFIRRLDRRGIRVDLVASHGQTIRHCPVSRQAGKAIGTSLQIGSAARIAAATGLVTIANFRQADIALGNEGAPITTAAMERIFADRKSSRLIVNIGGMANYFYFPARSVRLKSRAGDCGPGNSLSDIICSKLHDKNFDMGGKMAAAGASSQRLLTLLTSNKFFSGKAVSTGREQFGSAMAGDILDFGKKFGLAGEDLLATVGELTVTSIVTAVWPLVSDDKSLTKLYLTGGGRKNMFYVNRLSHYLPDLEIRSIDELGINGDYIEAVSYAILGEAALRGEALPTRFSPGSRQKLLPVLGEITQPPVMVG